MSDPLLSLILLAAVFAALPLLRFFKTLDTDFGRIARIPILTGIAAGLLIRFTHPLATGIVLTIALLYVRHMGDETEAADGSLLGALTGAAAAIPLMVFGEHPCRRLGECLLAGTVAGYGITFAAFHVIDKTRRLILDAVTMLVAIGAAYAPQLVERTGMSERRIAVAVAIGIPMLLIATVFKQWPEVRAELRHEASLGFIDDGDVRTTAHPIRRLGRGGWTDAQAHREFVRLANKVALRKRQQRGRPEEIARLYQLEIIKLRMQVQQMSAIDRAARAHAAGGEMPSDTMREHV